MSRGRPVRRPSRGDGTPLPTRARGFLPRAVVILAAVLVVCCCLFDPEDGFFPRCPVRAATGLQCPGCGLQRAVHALSRGRLLEALSLNPLVLVAPVVLLAGSLWKGPRSERLQRVLLYLTALYLAGRNFF